MIRGSTVMAGGNAAAGEVDVAPFAGAMPKGIGAPEYLEEHPEFDGRGVIIAILDTGVDPGAAGLQVTSDGKPKILDILDCTGSGDINTSTIVEASSSGTILGIFNTDLKVNPEWKNPTGKWHVGYKRAFDLFPGGLQKRIEKERRKRLEEHQRPCVMEATKAVADAHLKLKSAKSVTEEEKKDLEEKETRTKLLNEYLENYKDPGPLIHTVVWNDGEQWLAALDTSDIFEPGSGKGALADFTPLADFAQDRQFGTFSAEDACNYGVHFYDDGNLLSVVVDCGSHGTHVAGIAAAYHPDDPDLNGIAPGAQIVSLKIGDSRLSGMESNVGLTRALIEVLSHKADLINLSYGESTATPNAGRFIELANEVVNEHGIIFISSAGNAGPALSTVGAPGGTSSSIVSVGAYVSPELAAAGHSVREALDQGQQYTWSSRGPTPDGHSGVVISAPGGAIAPVPQWTRQARQLMNGTSMASPCACGGFALLLSGLKATGQMITPNRVRRAVENTCKPVNEDVSESPLTYGRGLLQVHKAFELLQKTEDADFPDVRYEIKAKRSDGGLSQRGIYLREPHDSAQPSSYVVDVSPQLKEDADTKEECLRVEDKILLTSTASWATCPKVLLLPFNGRNFEVKVDPTKLEPGAHYAEICGTDSTRPWRGPLFRVPITVLRAGPGDSKTQTETTPTTPASNAQLGTVAFNPGKEVRRFLEVPAGATWGEIRIRAGSFDTPKMYMIRAAQLLPHTRYSDTEARTAATVASRSEVTVPFKIVGAATVEITLAQFWSSLGESTLDVEVVFYGIEAPQTVVLDGPSGVAKLIVRAPFRRQKVTPSAKLTTVNIPLRPSDAVLEPLSSLRDTLPKKRVIHRLELTYKLKVEEAGAHTPTLPMLNRYVYDSVVEAEMYMIYDANKKLLSVGDIYPEEATLQKGDYVIKLLLRHDDPQILEKLRDLPMVVERKLKDPISVSVYPTNSDAVKDKNAVKDFVLRTGERRALFVGPLTAEDKLPKDALPGRLLTGKLKLGKLSEASGSKDAPSASTLIYTVPPKKDAKEAPKVDDEAAADSSPTVQEQLREKLRDASVKFLEDSGDSADAAELHEIARQTLEDFPGHLPVLIWQLQQAESAWKKDKAADVKPVVEASDKVLAAVNQDDVARYQALKNPEEGPGASKRKREMDEAKNAIVSALSTKARVLLEEQFNKLVAEADESSASAEQPTAGIEAFKELRKWVDTTEAQFAVLHAKREAIAGRFGQAVRALQKAAAPADKLPDKEALELQIKLLGKLGWKHWRQAEESRFKDAFPPQYRPF